MLAQPDGGNAMAARQTKCGLDMDAEEIRGFNGREKRLPNPLDLFVVIVCLLHCVARFL
jgi:hypothetical protein